jgi:MarR family protein
MTHEKTNNDVTPLTPATVAELKDLTTILREVLAKVDMAPEMCQHCGQALPPEMMKRRASDHEAHEAAMSKPANTSADAKTREVKQQPAVVDRGFRRARYHSAVTGATPDTLPISPTRMKVLKAIHRAGKKGVRARDIMDRTKLPHGSVQQTLNWLRAQNLVAAQEDTQS